ncbi:MAG TPA: hydrogenase maturation protease [Methanoculleus sp.]|nr:hydrogenase maturation protease [Methanoculleus sp.]
MGNDAAGIRVGEQLSAAHPDLKVIDGGLGGLALIPLMEGYDRVVIVDAMTGFGGLGEVHVFTEPPPSSLFPMALHDVGVEETLRIASALGIAAEVVVVGIEGGVIEAFSDRMDPEVEAAVGEACRTVISLLQNR